MKLQAPMLSFAPQGGFGLYHPTRKKRPPYPYPIGLYPRFPYHHLFHPYGWYYQRRRTWHGIIWAAHRYTPSRDPKNPAQLVRRQIFADAVKTWQGMNTYTKNIYHQLSYPIHASGYNRFLRQYLLEH